MTSKDVCLDSNVFIAAFSPHEYRHEEALVFLQNIRQNTNHEAKILYEPALVLYEVNAALYDQQRQGEISAMDAQDLMEHFHALPILFQWAPELLQLTQKIANQLNLPLFYKAAYLAIAMSRDIPLITFDEEFLKKGKKIYKKILGYHDCYRLIS